jgi:hypothetical protein
MASAAYESDYVNIEEDKASGWVSFAAIMLGFAGAWNCFDGILALANSKVYTAHSSFVFSDLRTWGWIILLVGVAQILAAFAILAGSQFGRWFGVGCASVNAIAQLMFIPAAPFWALCMFAIDLLIIYGLSVYGGQSEAV